MGNGEKLAATLRRVGTAPTGRVAPKTTERIAAFRRVLAQAARTPHAEGDGCVPAGGAGRCRPNGAAGNQPDSASILGLPSGSLGDVDDVGRGADGERPRRAGRAAVVVERLDVE